MGLVCLLGGARSGKSRLAVTLAARTGRPVTFLATGEAGDAEMADRIERHRRERPASWRTIEEPLRLEHAIGLAAPGDCLVIDCLSLWVANAMAAGCAEEVERAGAAAAALAARRPGTTIAVSNEVGLGLVPSTALGRAYRDVLGRVNAGWATASDRAFLVVAGQVLPLSSPDLVHETDGS
jgi:adenosylcobinamide kinase/adenosylcobinamide-phosphate guanylyltransferase